MPNEIYEFLKANNLTDKSEKDFLDEYSDRKKSDEIHDFMVANKLTDKTSDEFYSTYLKKKEPAPSPSRQDGSVSQQRSQSADIPEKAPPASIALPQPDSKQDFFTSRVVAETSRAIQPQKQANKPTSQTSGIQVPTGQQSGENQPISSSDIWTGIDKMQPKAEQQPGAVTQAQKQRMESAVKQEQRLAEDIRKGKPISQIKQQPFNEYKLNPVEVIKAENPDMYESMTGEDYVELQAKTGNPTAVKYAELQDKEDKSKFETYTQFEQESNLRSEFAGIRKSEYDDAVRALEAKYNMPYAEFQNRVRNISVTLQPYQTEMNDIRQRADIERQRYEDAISIGQTDVANQALQVLSELSQKAENLDAKYKDPLSVLASIESDADYQRVIKKQQQFAQEADRFNNLTIDDRYKSVFEPRRQAQEEADRRYEENIGNAFRQADWLTDAARTTTSKMAKGISGILTTIVRPAADAAGLGESLMDIDRWTQFTVDQWRESISAKPSQADTPVFPSYAILEDGTKILLDDKGNVIDARTQTFRTLPENAKRQAIDKYNQNRNKYTVIDGYADTFRPGVAINNAAQVITDMALAMGAGRVAMATGIPASPALVSAYTTQMFADYKDEAMQSGMTERQAMEYALGISTLISMVETIVSPLETRLLNRMPSLSRKLVLSADDINKVVTGKQTVGQLISTGVSAYLKELKQELGEELFFEPLAQAVYNTVAKQMTGADLSTDIIPGEREALETAITVGMSTLFFSAGNLKTEWSADMGNVFKTAMENEVAFTQALDERIKIGGITESQKKDILKNYQEAKKSYDFINQSISDKNAKAKLIGLQMAKMQEDNLAKSAITPQAAQIHKDASAAIQDRMNEILGLSDDEIAVTPVNATETEVRQVADALLEKGEQGLNQYQKRVYADNRESIDAIISVPAKRVRLSAGSGIYGKSVSNLINKIYTEGQQSLTETDMSIYNANRQVVDNALAELRKQDTPSTTTPQPTPAQAPQVVQATEEPEQEKEAEPLGQTIADVRGQQVRYNGKLGTVDFFSDGTAEFTDNDGNTTVIDGANGNTSIEILGMRVVPADVQMVEEDVVSVDGVEYIIETEAKGNISALTPIDDNLDVITDEATLIEAEIARNSTITDPVVVQAIEANPMAVQAAIEATEDIDMRAVSGIFDGNLTPEVDALMDRLDNGDVLTAQEKGKIEDYLLTVIDGLEKLKASNPAYSEVVDNALKQIYEYDTNVGTRTVQAPEGRQVEEQVAVQEPATGVAQAGEQAVEEVRPKAISIDADGNIIEVEILADGKGTKSVLLPDGKQAIRANTEIFDSKEAAQQYLDKTREPLGSWDKDVESTAKALEDKGGLNKTIQQEYAEKAIKDAIKNNGAFLINESVENGVTLSLSEKEVRSANGLRGGDSIQPHPDANIKLTPNEVKRLRSIENAKELGDIDGLEYIKQKRELVNDIFNRHLLETNNPKSISEAYHKAKADGSNPELVKAVEGLLGKPSIQPEISPEKAEAVSEAEQAYKVAEIKQEKPKTPRKRKVKPADISDLEKNPKRKPESKVAEIQKLFLTHVSGLDMRPDQGDGTYLSTEKGGNRYGRRGKGIKKAVVRIKKPYVTDDTGNITLRTRLLNNNRDAFDAEDFMMQQKKSGKWSLDDLSDAGIRKLAAMTTDFLKSQGYDSIYFPESKTQEGELIVFDRENVTLEDAVTDSFTYRRGGSEYVMRKYGEGADARYTRQLKGEGNPEKPIDVRVFAEERQKAKSRSARSRRAYEARVQKAELEADLSKAMTYANDPTEYIIQMIASGEKIPASVIQEMFRGKGEMSAYRDIIDNNADPVKIDEYADTLRERYSDDADVNQGNADEDFRDALSNALATGTSRLDFMHEAVHLWKQRDGIYDMERELAEIEAQQAAEEEATIQQIQEIEDMLNSMSEAERKQFEEFLNEQEYYERANEGMEQDDIQREDADRVTAEAGKAEGVDTRTAGANEKAARQRIEDARKAVRNAEEALKKKRQELRKQQGGEAQMEMFDKPLKPGQILDAEADISEARFQEALQPFQNDLDAAIAELVEAERRLPQAIKADQDQMEFGFDEEPLPKQKKNDSIISKAKNYAADVIAGRKAIRRLSPEAEEGRKQGGVRNVEATIILAAGKEGNGKIEGREAQQQAIEEYAKSEGIWFADIDSNPTVGSNYEGLGVFVDSGMENQVYVPNDNPNVVRKTMKTTDPFNKNNPDEVLYHLETRIAEHNAGIGASVPYTVIGFGRLSNGEFVVIVEQPRVKNARLATREEIAMEMERLGYEPDGKDSFGDENHFLADVNPKNVLVDNDGNFHFIDYITDILYSVNEEDSIRIGQEMSEQTKPKEVKPTDVKSLAKALGEIFGLSEAKAKASAELIGKSIAGLVKSGVFANEKEFWDAFPTLSADRDVQGITEQQRQEGKGLYNSARNIINALSNPDVSTPHHEVSHWWYDMLEMSAQRGNDKAAAIMAAFDKFADSSEGRRIFRKYNSRPFNAADRRFRQELWARSYERFLYEGKAPKGLEGLFEQISQFFRDVYNAIFNGEIDIALTDGMRSVFGYILTGDDVLFEGMSEVSDADMLNDIGMAADAAIEQEKVVEQMPDAEDLFQQREKSQQQNKIKQYAEQIINGERSVSRLSQAEEVGRSESGALNQEATAIIAAVGRTVQDAQGTTASGRARVAISEIEENVLTDYAKQTGRWYESPKRFGKIRNRGQEQEVYYDGEKIVKFNDFSINESVQEFLDRIAIHALLFPSTKYEIIGFGKNSNGAFSAVVKQTFIEGEVPTAKEIVDYMKSMGFMQQEDIFPDISETEEAGRNFYNSDYVIEDLHRGNVIKGVDGEFYIIDPDIKLNTKDKGLGGNRQANEVMSDDLLFQQREGAPQSILFQNRQQNASEKLIADKIDAYAKAALAKNPDMTKAEFLSVLRKHEGAKKGLAVIGEDVAGRIFEVNKNPLSAEVLFDNVIAGAEAATTQSSARYMERALADADIDAFVTELNKIGTVADEINMARVEPLAQAIFDKMLASEYVDAAFIEFFDWAINKGNATADDDLWSADTTMRGVKAVASAQVFHKIKAYYKAEDNAEMHAKWTAIFAKEGRVRGQFISAMQAAATPEAIANRMIEEDVKGRKDALKGTKVNNKTGQQMVDELADAQKPDEKDLQELKGSGRGRKRAVGKAKRNVNKKRKGNKIFISGKDIEKKKQIQQGLKSKGKSIVDKLKGRGLLFQDKYSKDVLDDVNDMVDDIISIGAVSREQALDNFVVEMQGLGVKEQQAVELFNEVWNKDKQEAVRNNMTEYLAQKVADMAKRVTSPKKKRSTDANELLAQALMARVAEILPAGANQQKREIPKTWEKLAELVRNKQVAQKAWIDAVGLIKMNLDSNPDLTPAQRAEILGKAQDIANEFLDKPLPKTQVRSAVKSGLKDLGVVLDELIDKSLTEQNQTGETLAALIVEQTGLDAASAQDIVDAVMDDFNEILGDRIAERAAKVMEDNGMSPADLKKRREELKSLRDRNKRLSPLERLKSEQAFIQESRDFAEMELEEAYEQIIAKEEELAKALDNRDKARLKRELDLLNIKAKKIENSIADADARLAKYDERIDAIVARQNEELTKQQQKEAERIAKAEEKRLADIEKEAEREQARLDREAEAELRRQQRKAEADQLKADREAEKEMLKGMTPLERLQYRRDKAQQTVNEIENKLNEAATVLNDAFNEAIRLNTPDADKNASNQANKALDKARKAVRALEKKRDDALQQLDKLQQAITDREAHEEQMLMDRLVPPVKKPAVRKTDQQKIIDLLAMGVLKRDDLAAAFAEKFGFTSLTPQQIAHLSMLAGMVTRASGIEMRARLGKELSNYLESLNRHAFARALRFMTDLAYSKMLSGPLTWMKNIPIGSALGVFGLGVLPAAITSPRAYMNFLKDYKVLDSTGTMKPGMGMKTFADVMQTGFSMLDDMRMIWTAKDRRGSFFAYVFNNAQDIWDNATTPEQRIRAVMLIAISKFQYFSNFASAFDTLMNHKYGEMTNYMKEWGNVKKQGYTDVVRIAEEVRRRMGYDDVAMAAARQELAQIQADNAAMGIEEPVGYAERELKWLIMRNRAEEITLQAYESIKGKGLMGQPTGRSGKAVAWLQENLDIKDESGLSANVENTFKFITTLTIGLFTRIAAKSLNQSLLFTPGVGLFTGVFYEYKPVRVTKNGKTLTSWEWAINDKDTIMQRLAYQAVSTTMLLSAFAMLFRKGEDDEWELDPDRKIDFTLDMGAINKDQSRKFMEEGYQPLSFRIRNSDGTWGSWITLKYAYFLLPMGAILGGMRDRAFYLSAEGDIRKRPLQKGWFGRAWADMGSGIMEQSFNQSVRTITYGFQAAGGNEYALGRFAESITKPLKTLMPLGSNLERDVLNTAQDLMGVTRKEGTTAQRILFGGSALMDIIAENEMVDRWGNAVPKTNAIEMLASSMTFGAVKPEDAEKLRELLPYRIMDKFPMMHIPTKWSSKDSNPIKDYEKNHTLSDDRRIKLERYIAEKWGEDMDADFKRIYRNDLNRLKTPVDATDFMKASKAYVVDRYISSGTVKDKTGRRTRDEIPASGMYEDNPQLWRTIFPELAKKYGL